MAKFWTYWTIMIGVIMMCSLAGINIASQWVLDFFGISTTSVLLGNSAFVIAVLGVLTIAGGASAIVIGFFTKVSFEYVFLATFAASSLLTFVGVFVSIINYANGFPVWIYYPIWAIFGVLGIGYVISALDWVFNRGGT